ncbi:MAG: hypothetical protein WA138_06850 [Parvibaculum sp.]
MFSYILPWTEFAFCVGLIAVAGAILVKQGDNIAKLTGLSRSWIGLVLLASATSLPELFAGVSAASLADAPNIAVGTVLGSCIFNLVMLVLMDELSRDEPMYRRIDQGHILTAGFGVIMIGAVGAFVLLGPQSTSFQFLHISLYTPFIIVIYLIAMRAAFHYERRTRAQQDEEQSPLDMSLREAVLRYLGAAGVVALAGSWLPFIGQNLADLMGWQESFVGTLLIGGATSAPEFVVTISAFRLGAVDMAIGNVLGSNLFDILILAIDDIFYTKGALLSSVAPAHAVTAFGAMIMSGIFIVALLYRPETRLRGTIGWVSLSLLVVYVFSSYAIYMHGN